MATLTDSYLDRTNRSMTVERQVAARIDSCPATNMYNAHNAIRAATCRSTVMERFPQRHRSHRGILRVAGVLSMVLLAGCAVGPNYKRPVVQVPQTFRSPNPAPAPEPASPDKLK